jgi:3-methylcrotonyl-CoA carboxylase beta subunit
MRAQLKKFQSLLARHRSGGSDRAKELHKSRNKMLVRERVGALLDPGSSFLELSPLAGHGMLPFEVPSAGLVTGIGRVRDRLCMVVANDATVKGGTYFPMSVKKHLRAQEIAEKNKLPCIYLVDSGGAYLPMQSHGFADREHFGRIFFNQAQMSAKQIPQIAAVMGSCTAGGAYMPAMADQSVIVQGTGTIFLGGPPLVKAATGEVVAAEELGGAAVHCQKSGLVDHSAQNDQHAIQILRDICGTFREPLASQFSYDPENKQETLKDPEDLLDIVPTDLTQPFEIKEVVDRVVDADTFVEFKPEYGPTLCTGFAQLYGRRVGIVGNNGILFPEAAEKGAHFIQLCDSRDIPIIFFQNITGFMIGKAYEARGIAKAGAQMVNAVSCAKVPKFTVIVGASYGAGNYGMCGRAYDPSFVYMWPNAKIAVMGGEQAAQVLTMVNSKVSAEDILEKYEKESSALYSTARLWDDGVIDPRKTREVLGLSLEATLESRDKGGTEPGYGVFRT